MARTTPRKASKASIKAKADRAERRAKGEAVDATPEPSPLHPPEIDRGGRPSKYQKEFFKIAQAMCELGATDADLAAAFGVTTRTISNWQAAHPEFAQAVKVGKAPADDRVERSLYQRAVGFSYDAEKVFNGKDGIVRANTIEYVPPDTSAAMQWLTNRRPEKWRQKSQLEVGGRDGKSLGEELGIGSRELLLETARWVADLLAGATSVKTITASTGTDRDR